MRATKLEAVASLARRTWKDANGGGGCSREWVAKDATTRKGGVLRIAMTGPHDDEPIEVIMFDSPDTMACEHKATFDSLAPNQAIAAYIKTLLNS
jgi:hypothetical protein